MRSRVRSSKDKEGERWLEIARDGTIAVAVSGESFSDNYQSLSAIHLPSFSLPATKSRVELELT